MQKAPELKKTLKELLKILKMEKEALIKNENVEIAKIVERKLELTEMLEKAIGSDQKTDDEIRRLASEIKELQETNTLLTKQALSFQENLIASIAANISNIAQTYSQKGGYTDKNQQSGLIDQEI
ncbi:MAG: hypothetical protein RBT15_02510 [Gudongella sp.]|jgi:hypothetical protein|nr:hypothetical protein [Gudongella sp.]